jgi:hypothetical protein
MTLKLGMIGLDGYFLESVGGNQHLEQFKALAKFGKPVFIETACL